MGNRIFYSCLGVAMVTPSASTNNLPVGILEGVQSVAVDSNKSLEYFLTYGSPTVDNVLANTPDVSFSYSELLQEFENLSDTDGVNDYVDLYMYVGEDDKDCIDPNKYIACRYLVLESMTYNLSVDGVFTTDKSYRGFSRYICNTELVSLNVPRCGALPTAETLVARRQNFDLTGVNLPSYLTTTNALTNISITYNVNRQQVTEAGTKTPFGSAVTFPVDTTVKFTLNSQDLDDKPDPFATTTCQPLSTSTTDIALALCGNGDIVKGTLNINNLVLNSIGYQGGDTSGGNQEMTVEYVSYDSTDITPFISLPDVLVTGCGVDPNDPFNIGPD